ncbi:MAG: hypothetical protein NUV80_05905 [Candidatus Berkelbacteria bacterium]|nr:hypothetical protein [Candidatus Berkelbacteria bacterium]MCR4308067.1 hypothetical protein [Candidatus Berkelbacteria bacterium]
MLQAKIIESGFELKNSQQKLVLAKDKIELGELTVNEPGEYESEGIEIVYGQSAALVIWDKLQTVYVFGTDKPTSFEKSQFSPCDVVIFSQSSPSLTKTFFNETLEQYDPSVVIVSAKTNIEEVKPSFKTEPTDTAKLSDQTMPEEGRDFIVLT